MHEDRIEFLERRVEFLESTLARFMVLSLNPGPKHKGKTKGKDQAASVGGRLMLEKELNAALIDLLERAELSPGERMAMPDPGVLRRDSSR